MKKIVSIIIAAAITLSLTACGGSGSSGSTGGTDGSDGSAQGSASQTSGAAGDASAEGGSENPDKPWLSKPVKMTEEGKVDMEEALKYETDFEALEKSLAEREVDLSKPVSLNAQQNPDTMKVWELLKSVYGKKIISAQQQMDLVKTNEDKMYYNATEDLPAMKGFDFIFANGDNPDRGFIDAALKWAKESGGLVTFMWHWNVPRDADNPSAGRAFYWEKDGVKIINWNTANCTIPGTNEYKVVIEDIDLIASYLQELEREGITVLWRPFHEAGGNWFWWGIRNKDSVEDYRRLWLLMYDRLENYHKLSNLIWVWNGDSKKLAPDPNTYDIAGTDVYNPGQDIHSPLASNYKTLKAAAYEGKMLALTECGYIPDPQKCVDEDVMWLYYMPWNGGFVCETSTGEAESPVVTDFFGTPKPNPNRLTIEELVEFFSNDAVITFKDLPDYDIPYGNHDIPSTLKLWIYEKDQMG